MTRKITIANVSAKPGQTARGYVPVGETAISPIQFPVVIVNGADDGPVLCLTAGVHATEYAPIEAAFRLLSHIDARRLRGAVIAVPVVSMHMFAHRNPFVSPIDGLNLNKVAPGGDGSISELLVRVLLDEVISKAEYHVDLHAGDFGEMLLAFGGYSLTGNRELDEKGEALARLFSPHLVSLGSDEAATIPPFPGSINHAATRRGVVSILAESGGNGTLEERDVAVHVDGVLNVMRYLRMIEGEPLIRQPQVMATGRTITRARRAGLLRLKVAIGDVVSDGQIAAEICDVFGDVVEVVRVTRGGIAGLIWAHKVVNTGDPVVRCWYTRPAPLFPLTDKFLKPE